MVADPVGGVALDRVASEIAERRPGVEEAGRRGGDRGDARLDVPPRAVASAAAEASASLGDRRAGSTVVGKARVTCGSAGRSRPRSVPRRLPGGCRDACRPPRCVGAIPLGCGRARTQPRRSEERRARRCRRRSRSAPIAGDLDHEDHRAEGRWWPLLLVMLGVRRLVAARVAAGLRATRSRRASRSSTGRPCRPTPPRRSPTTVPTTVPTDAAADVERSTRRARSSAST